MAIHAGQSGSNFLMDWNPTAVDYLIRFFVQNPQKLEGVGPVAFEGSTLFQAICGLDIGGPEGSIMGQRVCNVQLSQLFTERILVPEVNRIREMQKKLN